MRGHLLNRILVLCTLTLPMTATAVENTEMLPVTQILVKKAERKMYLFHQDKIFFDFYHK